MNTPKIEASRFWSGQTVRKVCVLNDLFTMGDCYEYDEMLEKVRGNLPTYETIYEVAVDILKHSEKQTLANIMFLLENYAVFTSFKVNGSDEI